MVVRGRDDANGGAGCDRSEIGADDRRRDPADRCRRPSRRGQGGQPQGRGATALGIRECRLLLPLRPRRTAIADRPDLRGGGPVSCPADGEEARAEGQRAQYRLSADLGRGIAAGRRAGPQAEPERSLFPAPRARPRRSGGHRQPALSRPQSVARRSAGLSRDDARIHAHAGGALPPAGAALRLGARSARRFLRSRVSPSRT